LREEKPLPPSIARLGHPILRFPADPVDVDRLKAGELDELIQALTEVLVDSGATAVTAPQVGAELQVMAIRCELLDGKKADSTTRIIVNPMLVPEHGDLVYDWESCLSIPDLKGLVPRYPTVKLRGFDHAGKAIDLEASGEAARVLQHAHDHLSGVVFIDRMRDLRSLAFGDEWRQFLSGPKLDGTESEADS
jgi:peptide deformylase